MMAGKDHKKPGMSGANSPERLAAKLRVLSTLVAVKTDASLRPKP
jgi:hypothetical protein